MTAAFEFPAPPDGYVWLVSREGDTAVFAVSPKGGTPGHQHRVTIGLDQLQENPQHEIDAICGFLTNEVHNDAVARDFIGTVSASADAANSKGACG
ncbi:hypothetical protein [Aeromicrobium sp. 179-A 4D2 NHS]|uniref:hypothetical protein n=1 Tax=Aeromicrobium sp. 179-A 4D2 NHS TaxID=3142375 RepID=UPI00399FB8C2